MAHSRHVLKALPIFQGGPVQTERGFVVHAPLGDWEATLKVSDEIGVTVGEQHVLDRESQLLTLGQILLNIPLRIDDQSRTRGLVPDEIGGVR